ncbi:putative Zinc-ribbon domain [Trypanosoma melophagium]|uniref:putative Zinc-ribbon domain n=1 Tax=Trypanosoma melophagium TaxID=715481 RepID=UPI00351A8CA8|nr:putative Zinc-ribbon domain [Trypanosoma melophagium]
MIYQTRFLLAAEFKQKSRWSSVWPNMRYGAMYLSYSVGRQLPMKGVNWVTRDSNRLVNFANRYSSVIADIDVKKTEEELGVNLSDIRWNDHRRIYWKCSFCGSSYRKSVSVRTKFHAGCNFCKGRFPSEVLREQHTSPSLTESAAELLPQLVDNEKKENLATLAHTSKFRAEWKCQKCGESYRSTVRSRTGKVEEGQCPLHPDIVSWSAFCPSCSWNPNMASIADEVRRTGQFLGLQVPQGTKQQQQLQKPISRRKKLVS